LTLLLRPPESRLSERSMLPPPPLLLLASARLLGSVLVPSGGSDSNPVETRDKPSRGVTVLPPKLSLLLLLTTTPTLLAVDFEPLLVLLRLTASEPSVVDATEAVDSSRARWVAKGSVPPPLPPPCVGRGDTPPWPPPAAAPPTPPQAGCCCCCC
jgi:hypothetical protein